jgi:hypothetical protein
MQVTNQLDQEILELKGFIADLKADRAAQREKEKRESWTKYTSLSLVFIAVVAAIATQRDGKYSSRVLVELNNSTFNQPKASDQWSYYQAKSIKQNLYEALKETAPKVPEAIESVQAVADFNAKVAKYEKEKKDIKEGAEKLEHQVAEARLNAKVASEHGGGMATSISIFQISIALGSICLVTKKRSLWYLSLVLAGLAAAKMVMVWMM